MKKKKPLRKLDLRHKLRNAKAKEASGKELDCLELSDVFIPLLMEERSALLLMNAKETVS